MRGRPASVTDFEKITASKLKKKRILNNLTQKELGIACGVSMQQINKYEQGSNRISIDKLYRLSKLFKTPIEYFFNNLDPSQIPVFQEKDETLESDKKVIISLLEKMDKEHRSRLIKFLSVITW